MNSQWKILVVDDELIMRESMAAWLMEDGYLVETAESGHEAIELVKNNQFAICFIDLKMPGIDGIEAMMEILKIQPEISAIIITAYASKESIMESMDMGVSQYLEKPFPRLDVVSDAIEKALRNYRLRLEFEKQQKSLRETADRLREISQETKLKK